MAIAAVKEQLRILEDVVPVPVDAMERIAELRRAACAGDDMREGLEVAGLDAGQPDGFNKFDSFQALGRRAPQRFRVINRLRKRHVMRDSLEVVEAQLDLPGQIAVSLEVERQFTRRRECAHVDVGYAPIICMPWYSKIALDGSARPARYVAFCGYFRNCAFTQ